MGTMFPQQPSEPLPGAINPLQAFMPKLPSADDGASGMYKIALGKVNALLGDSQEKAMKAQQELTNTFIPAMQGNGEALKATQDALLQIEINRRVHNLVGGYVGKLGDWLANHAEPPVTPQPEGELAIYFAGITF